MSLSPDNVLLALETYINGMRYIAGQSDYGKLAAVRDEKLRKLVRYAASSIKYYKEIFQNERINPQAVRTAEDLRNVPFLTKQQLRERFWDFLPAQLPPCRVSRTSGSTGVPVCLLSDRSSRLFNSAAVIRYRKALGVNLVGTPILTPLKTETDSHKDAHWTFMQGLHKTHYINPYIDTAKNIDFAHKLFGGLRRSAIIGITPAIKMLALRIRDGKFPQIRPKVVITTGEVLMPEVKNLLVSVFNAPVADIYACNEAGDIAWQCLEGKGYHVNIDNVIVEIVKDGQTVPSGETGEVVITNLNRFAMPIIRYKNGDLAQLSTEDCPCGCRLPLIERIIGRSGEDIFLPDGKRIPWNQLKGFMNDSRVRQFQIIQNADGSLTIKYVKEPSADIENLENLIMQRFKTALGENLKIEIVEVRQISPAKSGKSKLVVSHFKPEKI